MGVLQKVGHQSLTREEGLVRDCLRRGHGNWAKTS